MGDPDLDEGREALLEAWLPRERLKRLRAELAARSARPLDDAATVAVPG